MSLIDMGAPPGGQQQDPSQMLRVWALMQQQRNKDQNQTPAGAAGNALAMFLMNPELMKSAGQGWGNLMSGATPSAWGQYLSPYGATGAGMAPIVGPGGMMGGGV